MFSLYPSFKDVRGGTQGSNLAAGTEAKTMEECCLLTVGFSACFVTTQYHLSEDGTLLSVAWAFPH